MNFKNIAKTAKACLKLAKKYGPQLMALGSAACYITAIIFAVKEAPEAMEALDERESENEDMNIIEKGATLMSNMKKTVIFATAGTGLSIATCFGITGQAATLGAGIAAAKGETADIVQASREVVGQEKTEEILERKKQYAQARQMIDPVNGVYDTMHPYIFSIGFTVWMTPAQYFNRLETAKEKLSENQLLSANEFASIMGYKWPIDLNVGWSYDPFHPFSGNIMGWADEMLSVDEEVVNYGDHITGYAVSFRNKPREYTSVEF